MACFGKYILRCLNSTAVECCVDEKLFCWRCVICECRTSYEAAWQKCPVWAVAVFCSSCFRQAAKRTGHPWWRCRARSVESRPKASLIIANVPERWRHVNNLTVYYQWCRKDHLCKTKTETTTATAKTADLEMNFEGRDHNWTSPTSKTVLTTDITKL